MRQYLWVLNTSLLCLLFITSLINQVLRIEQPPFPRKKDQSRRFAEKKKEEAFPARWEKIYRDDLFSTYKPTETKPAQKDLLTPIPEQATPAVTPPPEAPKQEFIAALTISIKGIIISSDEAKSVVMIEDETKKEGLYHLGEKVKDAQIIKISRNRVVFLRANGQQEIFFLRADDPDVEKLSPERWNYIIKKIDDQTYLIDKQGFVKEVESLGNFIERASLVGTAYVKGSPIGIRVGNINEQDLAKHSGLEQDDIIVSVNGIETAPQKNRMKIYEAVINVAMGSTIPVGITRKGKSVTLNYKIDTIPKQKKVLFSGEQPAAGEQPKKEADEFSLSKTQQREKLVREFKQRHPRNNDHQKAVSEIRERLLENLRSRFKNTRVRTP